MTGTGSKAQTRQSSRRSHRDPERVSRESRGSAYPSRANSPKGSPTLSHRSMLSRQSSRRGSDASRQSSVTNGDKTASSRSSR
jgi:hypothetical protein